MPAPRQYPLSAPIQRPQAFPCFDKIYMSLTKIIKPVNILNATMRPERECDSPFRNRFSKLVASERSSKLL